MSDKKFNKVKLQVLFLTYGDKYSESFDILYTYLKKLNEYCDITINTIDNKMDSFSLQFKNAHIELIGDNSAYEFSGWDRGIKYLKQSKVDYDVCLFVNDSFVTNSYFQNKELLSIDTINKCMQNNALVGKIDRLDRLDEYKDLEYTINNKDVTSWVRTNLFYMTKPIIEQLGQLTTYNKNKLNDYMSENYKGAPFLKCANISIFLQCQMIKYFTKFWHSVIPINEENWNTWKFKVLGMLNEKMLTYRVKELGFEVIDYEE